MGRRNKQDYVPEFPSQELVRRGDYLPQAWEGEERRRSVAGAMARGVFKLGYGTLKTPFKVAHGIAEFGWAARKNTLGGHARKVVGVVALSSMAWVGHSDHEPATDKHNTVQVATVEIGTPNSMLGEKAAEAKNLIRHGVNFATLHHLFDDNRQLSEVADWLSEDRGYYIPVERLVALNADSKLIQRDSDGKVMDELRVDPDKGATWRVEVPGPIYKGYHVVDEEGESLETVSTATKVPMKTLRQWNPGLAKYDNGQELPKGALVQIEATIDKRLVLRKMTNNEGSLRQLLQKYHALQGEIILANGPIIGSGEYAPDSPGQLGYFPLVGGETKKNKQHFEAAQINAAFSPAGAPIDVSGSQVGGGKKPPKIPKPTPKPPSDKPGSVEDNTGNKGGEHISINTDIFKGKHAKEQAAIAQIIVDTAYDLDIPEKYKYKAAEIGLITAFVESDMRNLEGGDRDSVGVFQQRNGWGSYAQRHNVQWATNTFYHGGSKGYSEPGLLDIKNWYEMPSGDAAQKVQVSAFPKKYAKRIDEARKILRG